MAQVIRQGDVVLVRSERPTGAARRLDAVLAHGEATGHAHRLVGGVQVAIGGSRYVGSTGAAVVEHEEHAHVRIPRGLWRVQIQQEWTPTATRRVRD